MKTLIIRQVETGDPPKFQAISREDGQSTDSAPVAPPVGFPVEGRPNSDLMTELRWYLEEFLGYPFPPETEHAERVQAALRSWGQQAFNSLFGDRRGGQLFDDLTREGYEHLHLVISSDDPQVLGWPWEALRDPQAGQIAQTCQVERRLNTVRKPDKLARSWPDNQVNILLVTARPFEADVRYRSISRPLVELIDKQNLPAQVTVLRPPTLDRLREHLRDRPNHYHIVHFDGHGSYDESPAPASGPHSFRAEGRLIFEDDKGKPDPITAEQLSVLLREHHIPAVVLNACQSAMVGPGTSDLFASVAAALVKSGTRSVVAMAYSLYVSGAQEFLPAFYRDLFRTGDMTQAARSGRQRMFQQKDRVCARGRFPLDDWLVPVVYQQEPFDFSFAKTARKAETDGGPALPDEARDTENPYGFVGRDGAVLALERAMRRPPAGLLIQGLGGVGKTTLARGFLQWLRDTDGLGLGAFWFTFQDIRSAEFVLNRMGEALFGPQFSTAEAGQKLDALADAFQENRFVIVWDNFEVVRGIPGTSVVATLSGEDQALLKTFLAKLRGGQTKVIITSRSDEAWLEHTNRFEIRLGGLQGEEQWDYCEVILRDLGLTIDRKDVDLMTLMDLLGGHPLAMRVILPRLAKLQAAALIQALQSNLTDLGPSGDPTQDKLFATLRFAEQSLPDDLRPLLVPLALHERFVQARLLHYMAERVEVAWTRVQIDRFLGLLAVAGLLQDWGQGVGIFGMHPALTGFLRATHAPGASGESGERWCRAFVDVMSWAADEVARMPLHHQRLPFFLHGTNFHVALGEAERLGMSIALSALIQSLAVHAQNTRNFQEAARLYERNATEAKKRGDAEGEASAYHQLGIVAQERRDLDAAERWCRKALEITERQGDEHGAMDTYHELGAIAEARRDFDAADRWYRKSLEITERLGDEHGAAVTYRQLGMVAEARRNLDAAERWYRRAMEIKKRQGDENGAASTYHQMGRVAEERRDFDAAERWYRKALKIQEKQGDEHGAALAYHQLGMVAEARRNFDAADRWYRKSLEITERQGDEHSTAATYHQLGMVAEARRDFEAAEQWYRKSLEIKERQGDEHGAALTYHQLGTVAEARSGPDAAEQWYRKSLEIAERQDNGYGAAITYHQMGMVAEERRDFDAAERWYRKSLEIKERQGNEHGAANTYHQLGMVAEARRDPDAAEQWYRKSLAVWVKYGDKDKEMITLFDLERLRNAAGPEPPSGSEETGSPPPT